MLFRYFLLVLGILIGLPLLVFLSLIPKTPISSAGIRYLLSYILIAVGLVCAHWWTMRSTAFIFAGSMVAIVTITVRLLAGLSNGAIGASRLAEKFQNDFAGLILISGADPAAMIMELPVLLVHGKYDERIPVSLMERYVHAAGPKATYHLFESDHFVLLKQADEVQSAIADWFSQQESNRQSK